MTASLTLLFTTIDLLRNEFAKLGPFWWMIWNACLALIPVGLAILFLKRSEQPNRRVNTPLFFLELGLIMLFLPNAPYIATDLIHFLENVRNSDRSLWKLLGTQFPIYVGFVLLGLISYAFTEDRILFALQKRLGRTSRQIALVLIPLLSAIGIYLGRVARFNSWDILQDPLSIARSSRGAIVDMRMATIILWMSVLLFVGHQAYKIFHDGLRYRKDQALASKRVRASTIERHSDEQFTPVREKS